MTESAAATPAPSAAPSPSPSPSRKSLSIGRKLVITSLVAGAAIGLYALAGFVAVPALVKFKVPELVQQKLKRQASIGEIKINPFTLRVEASAIKLAEADGRPIAGIEALTADMEWSSLWKRAWHLAEVRVSAPRVLLDIAPDGRINLADLVADLTRDAPKEPRQELPRLVIDALVIERGKAEFADRRAGYANALTPIDLRLQNLSTLPQDKGPYTFSAATANGGQLRWKGEIALNPLAANGLISAQDISLPALAAYLKPFTTAHVADGKVGFELPYRVSYRDGRLDAALDGASARVAALALKLDAAAPGPFFALTSVKIDNIRADYAKRELSVADVALEGGNAALRRDAKGSIDVLGLIKPSSGVVSASAAVDASVTATATAAPSAPALPWKAKVERISLDQFALGLQDQTAVTPLTASIGRVQLKAVLSAEAGAELKLNVTEVAAALHSIALGPKGAPLVRVDSVSLDGGALDLAARSVTAQSLRVSDGQIKVVRDANGQINLLAMLPQVPGGASASPLPSVQVAGGTLKPAARATKPDAAPAWKLALATAELAKFTVQLEEQETGIALNAQDIGIKLTEITNDLKRPLKFIAGLSLKEGGKLSAQGQALPAAASVEAAVKMEQLALKPVQPLVDKFVRLKLAGGSVSAAGKVAVRGNAGAGGGTSGTAGAAGSTAPLLRYDGTFEVAGLQLNEENGELFAAWKSVGADHLNLTLQPNALEIPELRVAELNAKLLIEADRSLNAQRLLVRAGETGAAGGAATAGAAASAVVAPANPVGADKPAAAVAAVPSPGSQAESAGASAQTVTALFPITVRRVRISNGKLDFADLSLRPQFGAKIHELNGVINGLSTNQATRSQLELDGRVDEFGLARIRGELNPFAPRISTDVGVVFKNVDMVSASPYSMKFAGYKIASGKISLDLKYKVRHSKLEGENNVVLDQLTLGERVDSPDAMKLPLELALAILKDSDGKIDLDLPVSGSLDDPQFSYGAIVWKAVLNVIGKIVTAPFRALGALFGVSGDKLESIDFDAGSAALLPPEREKLKQVATVLSKRAQLQLAVPPHYSEAADSAALRVSGLRRELARRAGVRVAEGEEPGPPDLADRAMRDALRALLAERHGAPEWDKRKAEAEQTAAARGAQVSVFERAQRITQGEPQVSDLAPLYRSILERVIASQPLAPDALPQLAKRRSDAIVEALKTAGVEAARLTQPAVEKTDSAEGKPVPLKLGLSSR